MGKYDTSPQQFVAKHGKTEDVQVDHQPTGSVVTANSNGHSWRAKYGNKEAAEHAASVLRFEEGGVDQASSPKKRNHPDQQGSESADKGYVVPDLAI